MATPPQPTSPAAQPAQASSNAASSTPTPPAAANTLDKTKSLQYPMSKNLGSEDYLLIEVLKYVAPGLSASGSNVTSFDIPESSNRFEKVQFIKQISLPIPSGINESNTVGWAAGSMNPLVSKVLSGNALMDQNTQNVLQTALGGFTGAYAGLDKAIGDIKNTTKNTAAMALAISNITGQSEIQQALARNSGTIFNQNIELLFNNINLRTPFSFTFTLSPRNEIESLHVKAIIRCFKQYMSPQRKAQNNGNGLLISAPHVFRLRYMHGNKDHPFLHKFKTCALTNMNVNYTGSNVYATYPDGAPVHIEMGLTFQELSPIYFEDYANLKDNEVGF